MSYLGFILSLNLICGILLSQEISTTTKKLSKQALEIIVKKLKSNDSDIKCYAIEALSKTGETKLIPILKNYLNDQNKYVVISTAKALWHLGSNEGLQKLVDIIYTLPDTNPTDTNPLTQIKIISTNKIREKALETLVELEGINAKKLVLDIKENDPFGTMRDAAARELAKIGYKNEMDIFLNALKSDDEEIRNQAAENLSKICPHDGSKIIEALKKEKSIRVKMLLLNSLRCSFLSKKDDDEVFKYLIGDNPTLRLKAAEVLINSKNNETVKKLKDIYNDTPDINLKLTILRRLTKEGMKLSESDIDYLNSVENTYIKKGFIAIADSGGNYSLKYLEKYLKDNDPYVAIDAAIKIIEMEKSK